MLRIVPPKYSSNAVLVVHYAFDWVQFRAHGVVRPEGFRYRHRRLCQFSRCFNNRYNETTPLRNMRGAIGNKVLANSFVSQIPRQSAAVAVAFRNSDRKFETKEAGHSSQGADKSVSLRRYKAADVFSRSSAPQSACNANLDRSGRR